VEALPAQLFRSEAFSEPLVAMMTPAGKPSGLKEAWRILKGIDGIRFITFTERDVARHHLVQEIISAYDRDEVQAGPDTRNPPDKPAG